MMNIINTEREKKTLKLTVSRVLDNSGMVKIDTKESGWKKENSHILYQCEILVNIRVTLVLSGGMGSAFDRTIKSEC